MEFIFALLSALLRENAKTSEKQTVFKAIIFTQTMNVNESDMARAENAQKVFWL